MKPIELREADFKRQIAGYKYPQVIKDEFFAYWTEPNKSESKMRFELEKTWHLGRRLARWAANSKTVISKTVHVSEIKKQPEPVTNVEKLDAFINMYRAKPSEIEFKLFGLWYDYMKSERLLAPMYPNEIKDLREVYGEDNYKCRCAVVQKTLNGYINNGLRVADLMKMRAEL